MKKAIITFGLIAMSVVPALGQGRQSVKEFLAGYRQGMDTVRAAVAGVSDPERDGRWYYLSSVANFYLGNKVTALEHARRAVEIDPGNEDYRRLLQQLQTGGDFYDRYARGYTRSVNLNPLWLGLCAASLCTGGRCGFLPLVFCC